MTSRRAILGLALALLALPGCVYTSGPTQPTGVPAPSFDATSHQGERITSSELLATGPLVIVFYRGFW